MNKQNAFQKLKDLFDEATPNYMIKFRHSEMEFCGCCKDTDFLLFRGVITKLSSEDGVHGYIATNNKIIFPVDVIEFETELPTTDAKIETVIEYFESLNTTLEETYS